MKKKQKANFRWIDSKSCYEYRFTYKGNRYSVYGRNPKECTEKADAKKELINNHLSLENRNITLAAYYKEIWLPEQEKKVKPSTLYAYEKAWICISKPLGKHKLADITKAKIIKWQKDLLSDKTPAAANRCLKHLRQILKSALEDRIITFNPASNVSFVKVERKAAAVETNHRALTPEETKQFLNQAEGSHYYLLFKFLLNTGCRIGEAVALEWSDIDYVRREIHICKTVSRTSHKTFEIMDTPKTQSSNRVIPLTDMLEKILKEQRQINIMLYSKPFERRIFLNRKGETVTYLSIDSCIANIITQASKKQPLGYFSVHAFRDTFATRAIEQGMQPNTLKTILGHSSLKMTMDLYAHVMPTTKHEEMNKLVIAV